ncbi:MAG: restriction endonuclease subunit S [Colwellia sp.]|nr:restriction endonuclease subunit S [Colwellia sp.]
MTWPLVKLGDLVTIKGGGTPSKKIDKYWNGDIPWASVKDLKSNKISKTVDSITELGVNNSATNLIPAGTIITATRMALGKFVINTIDMAINQDLKALFINDASKVDRDFLIRFLESKAQYIDGEGKGATVKGVTLDFLKALDIPLPPLAEQKRIAAILDKADAICRKRQQAINLADDFLRSVFLDMFGDPLAPNTKIPVLPMTEVFNITTGKLNSNAAVENGKYPFFTCAKEVFAIDEYAFDIEALMLAGNNAQAKYDVKHYSGKFNAYQRTYILTLKDSNSSYPFYKFALEYQLKNLQRFSKGSNTKYITMEIMARTMLPVPSYEMQKRFVDMYIQKQDLNNKSDKQKKGSNDCFNSLSQKAFAGKL